MGNNLEQPFLVQAQHFLGPLALGIVLNGRPNADNGAVFSSQYPVVDQHRKGGAVFSPEHPPEGLRRRRLSTQFRQGGPAGSFFLRGNFPDKLPQQFFGGVPQHFQFGIVDASQASLGVHFVKTNGGIVEQVFEFLLAPAQRFLRPLALGDVLPDSHQTANPSLAVPKRQFGRQHRVRPAIQKNHAVFMGDEWLSSKNFHLLGAELGGQSGGVKVRVGQAKKLGGSIFAVLFRQGFVDNQKTAVQVFDIKSFGQQINQCTEQLAFAGNGFLRPLALGDVVGDAAGADNSPRVIPQGQLGGQHPRFRAIGPRLLLFDVHQGLARADDLLLVSQRLAGVFLGEEIRIRFADHLRRVAQAKPLDHGRIDAEKTTGGVLEIDGIRKILHQGRHQGLFVV